MNLLLPSMETYFPATCGLDYYKLGCIHEVFTFAIICQQKTLRIQEININLKSINNKHKVRQRRSECHQFVNS